MCFLLGTGSSFHRMKCNEILRTHDIVQHRGWTHNPKHQRDSDRYYNHVDEFHFQSNFYHRGSMDMSLV